MMLRASGTTPSSSFASDKNRRARGPLGSKAVIVAGSFALCSTPAGANESSEASWLREIVVTSTPMSSPLTIEMDAKVPRQPLPAHDGADYLRSVAGFAVIRKGGTDSDAVFRGMAASRINIRADGQQTLGGCDMRMDPPTAYIFPEMYDRIVIVKGPQSVQYGPGTSAATVLFQRDPPQFETFDYRARTSVVTASADRTDLVADITAGSERLYGQLSATRAEADDYEDGDGNEVHSKYLRWNANALLGWTPNENTRLELSAGRNEGEAAYADRMMDGASFERESFGLRYLHENEQSFVRKVEMNAYYGYIDHVMDNYSLRPFMPSMMMPNRATVNSDRRTLGGRVAVDIGAKTSRHVTLGIDAKEDVHTKRSSMDVTMTSYSELPRIEDARLRHVGVFAEGTWPLSERQRLVAGLRADRWHARDSRQTLPIDEGMNGSMDEDMGGGMAMMSTPNPTAGHERNDTLGSGFIRWEGDVESMPATFYVGIGHVERFPDYWELVSSTEGPSSLSAFETRPEQTTQLDIGALFSTPRLSASVAAFLNRIDDYILIQSDYEKGMRSVSVSRNVDAATVGAEFDLAFRLSERWKLTGAAAYVRGRNESDDIPLAQLPPLELRAGISYEAPSWSTSVLARWADDQRRYALHQGNIVGQDLGPTESFTTVGVNASWRPTTNILVSGGVDNLFDRTYAEHLSRSAAMAGSLEQIARVNEPGRTLWMRISADFN